MLPAPIIPIFCGSNRERCIQSIDKKEKDAGTKHPPLLFSFTASYTVDSVFAFAILSEEDGSEACRRDDCALRRLFKPAGDLLDLVLAVRESHLHEFVTGEGTIESIGHSLCISLFADVDDSIELLCMRAEKGSLITL